ncbi:MAG: dTDP-4-dehydrorhamnose 3,5-epimerase [Gemmatimonadota bacterium]|jgi:dTDP-4-dehydrorhamnose 3,5-epimerase
MVVEETGLPGVLLLEPRVFRDDRGWFRETWREKDYGDAGIPPFVQDNAAFSRRNVLRGLHYQWPDPQGKLVYATYGSVFDVAVDIRRGSPFFGKWEGLELSADNGHQLWIPPGFAHGYVVLSDAAVVAYRCTAYYRPDADAVIAWDDPRIGVDWPVQDPVLSAKDAAAPPLADIAADRLPGGVS